MLGKSRSSERAVKGQYLCRIGALAAGLTQQNHCVFHGLCWAPFSCVFTDVKAMCLRQKVQRPLRCGAGSKGPARRHKILFPLDHVCVFMQRLPTRAFHLPALHTATGPPTHPRSACGSEMGCVGQERLDPKPKCCPPPTGSPAARGKEPGGA